MKKFITFLACAIFSVVLFSSCHGVSPEADEEAVLIDYP